jgi:hypothetical protein
MQTNNSFKIDIKLENKLRDLTICREKVTESSDSQKIESYCLRLFHQNCIKEYFEIDSKTNNNSNETILVK